MALEAAIALPVFWTAVRLFPFGRLQDFLHKSYLQTKNQGKVNQNLSETEIVTTVRAVARWLPCANYCLVLSLTSCLLLRKRGYPVVIKIGVAKEALIKSAFGRSRQNGRLLRCSFTSVNSAACNFRSTDLELKSGLNQSFPKQLGLKAHCWLENEKGEVLVEDPEYISAFKTLSTTT